MLDTQLENFWKLDTQNESEIKHLQNQVFQIKSEISKFIVGQHDVIDLIIIALFTKGHVLLEGVPGLAKTYLAKHFAQTVDSQFNRIQFTPDLMPSDILGTNIFNPKNTNFEFKKGPIFTNIILIDEINRAPAKTQSALFEVMQEKQITMDGQNYPFDTPFMVIATQNPIEQEGTYKLPEAQLDRFLFKINLKYPTLSEELEILNRFEKDIEQLKTERLNKVIDKNNLNQLTQIIEQIYIKSELVSYIAQVINESRINQNLYLGASPRASLAILKTSKALAAINGRNFVIPEDIQYVSQYVLNHRIILNPEKEMEGVTSQDVIKEMLSKVEIPR